MIRKNSFQKISDDIIIQKISSDFDMVKEAGLFDDLGLDTAAAKIKSLVRGHLGKADSMEDVFGIVGDLLITGTLFKVHPVLGFGYAMAEALGVDIKGMVKDAIDAIRGKGEPLSESEFSSIAKNAMESPLLIKEAQWRTSPTIPFFGGRASKWGRKPGIIVRIFGDLFRKGKRFKAKWLAKGLVIWTLKTALLGAGLLVGAGALTDVGKGLFGEDEEKETEQPNEIKQVEEGEGTAYTTPKSKPKPGWKEKFLKTRPGFVNKRWKNDDENVWVVDLSPGGGTVEGTLLAWTADIYPELGKLKNILPGFPSFRRTVSMLKSNYSPRTPNALVIPTQFNSRKQIVDTFAKEVAQDVAEQISRQTGKSHG